MKTITVHAIWDEEARVWAAEASNLPKGFALATGADTLDALAAKLPAMVQDLLEMDVAPAIKIIAEVNPEHIPV